MATITTTQSPSSNIPAFLDLIAFSEGTSTSPITANDGYDVIVTGVNGPAVFTDYSQHPCATPVAVQAPSAKWPEGLFSTAAGRYQLLHRYWVAYCAQLGLHDFSPLSQDVIAIQQIKERGALGAIADGKIETAIQACSNIWASMPGNNFGQGGHSMEELLAQWAKITGGQQ